MKPEFINVVKTRCGLGLVSTKAFKRGDFIYSGDFRLIDNVETSFVGEDLLTLDSHVHAVLNPATGKRELYGFDSHMNHSCEPNTYSVYTSESEYDTFACLDIDEGDELTCDYCLFDYTCDGHEIMECMCGSSKCRRTVRGFKYLSLDQKLELLPHVEQYIKDQFQVDEPCLVVEDLRVPPALKVVGDNGSRSLVALQDFRAGDVLFSNVAMQVKKGTTVVYKLAEEYFTLGNDNNADSTNPELENFYYFDAFMNHSCEPNTGMRYFDELHYEQVALVTIAAGEELTCNYRELFVQEELKFKCKCGSLNCIDRESPTGRQPEDNARTHAPSST